LLFVLDWGLDLGLGVGLGLGLGLGVELKVERLTKILAMDQSRDTCSQLAATFVAA